MHGHHKVVEWREAQLKAVEAQLKQDQHLIFHPYPHPHLFNWI